MKIDPKAIGVGLYQHDVNQTRLGRGLDAVVEDGEGEEAVTAYLKNHHKRANAQAALSRVRQLVNPVTYDELIARDKTNLDIFWLRDNFLSLPSAYPNRSWSNSKWST